MLGREFEIVVGDNLTLRARAVIGRPARALSATSTKVPPCTRPRQILSHDTTRRDIYRQTYEDYLALMTALAPIMHESVDRLQRG